MKKEQYFYFNYIDPATDIENAWTGNFYELCCKLGIKGKELTDKLRNDPESLPFEIHSGTCYTDFKYDKENFKSFCQSKLFWNQLSEQAEAGIKDHFGGDYSEYEPMTDVGEESIKMVFGLNCKIKDISNKFWFVVLPKSYYSFIVKKQYSHIATMKIVFREIEKDIELSRIDERVRSKVKYHGWLNWYNVKIHKIKFDLYVPDGIVTKYDGGQYTKYLIFDIQPHFEKLQYIYS